MKLHEKVDIVVARNVFSHVPDLVNCLKGVSNVLNGDGLFVIEFHEANKILNEIHYDSIYHEHTFYHSIKSISVIATDCLLFLDYLFCLQLDS